MILDRGRSTLAVHHLELSEAGLGQQKCSLLGLTHEDRMLEKGSYQQNKAYDA